MDDIIAVHVCLRSESHENVHKAVQFITKCTNVKDVSLAGCQVNNDSVSELAKCKKLKTLDLMNTTVSDISTLASCSKLEYLNITGTKVAEVSCLASCPSLNYLDITDSNVTDVTCLVKCKELKSLNVGHLRVTGISELANCPNLRTLWIAGKEISLDTDNPRERLQLINQSYGTVQQPK